MNHDWKIRLVFRLLPILFLLGWVLPNPSFGQTLPDPPPTSCLWKVESNRQTLYLLGSIHVLKKESFPLNEAILQAFRQVDSIVLEIDPGAESSSLAQARMVQKGLLPDDQHLPDHLSPTSYAMAKTYLTQHGMSIDTFDRFKPWLLALTLAGLELHAQGFSPAYGIDHVLGTRAKVEGKSIQSLETMEYQLSLFDAMPPATQEQFVMHTLTEMDYMETETQHLLEAWKHGNLRELNNLIATMKAFPDIYNALLVKRNQNWLPRIEELLAKKTRTLVIVGVLHLIGPDGLVALLQGKGYTIQQL